MGLKKSARRIFYRGVQRLPEAIRRPLRDSVRRVFPSYLTILDLLHDQLRPSTYVEIGVKHGRSLARARPETLCVGIDPRPQLERVPPNAEVFELTSDDFFRRHALREVLGGRAVDLAFIDGQHTLEASLRDFINLERACSTGSVIAIHDCYPKDERRGDGVWQLIVCLKEYRPDLRVVVVEVPPTGLGLVTLLDPSSRVLEERYDEICGRFADLGYDEVAPAKRERLNLVPADRDVVKLLSR